MVYIEKEKKKRKRRGKKEGRDSRLRVRASLLYIPSSPSFVLTSGREAGIQNPTALHQASLSVPTAIHAVYINFYLVFASLRVLLIKTQMTDTHFSL